MTSKQELFVLTPSLNLDLHWTEGEIRELAAFDLTTEDVGRALHLSGAPSLKVLIDADHVLEFAG